MLMHRDRRADDAMAVAPPRRFAVAQAIAGYGSGPLGARRVKPRLTGL
jgi:hypothetical protein